MPSLVAPTHNALGVPTEIRFDASQLPSGKAATFPIWTFDQLDNMPLMTLKNKARGLVETIGEGALPPLSGSPGKEGLMTYIMDVQISLCATIGLRCTMQAFGAPRDWNGVDDQGYFGGDGAMPLNAKNYLEADYRKPMQNVQPAHRGLSMHDAAEVNQAEANMGFEAAKRRNAGSVMFG
jgi:hypothetical protein